MQARIMTIGKPRYDFNLELTGFHYGAWPVDRVLGVDCWAQDLLNEIRHAVAQHTPHDLKKMVAIIDPDGRTGGVFLGMFRKVAEFQLYDD